MKFSQVLSLLVLFMMSFIVVIIFGALVSLNVGVLIFSILLIIITFLLLLFIERFVLGLIGATSLNEREMLYSKVRNLAIRVGVDDIDIYCSDSVSQNVYAFIGLSKRPVLVIGNSLKDILDAPELDALILASLHRIYTGDSRFQTCAVSVSIIFYLPFLLDYGKGPMNRFIRGLLMYYHSPFEMLRVWLIRNDKRLLRFDREVATRYDIVEELASAYFKMAHLPRQGNHKFIQKILESFTIANTCSVAEVSRILSFGITMEDRYLELRK